MIVLGVILILAALFLLHSYILLVIGVVLTVAGLLLNYHGGQAYAEPGPAPWYHRRWY